MRRLGVILVLLLAGLPGLAFAQIDSREGIALQNQILQLRQELEALRRGGGGTLPPPQPQGSGSFLGLGAPTPQGAPPQAELVGTLLERVSRMEEELRRVRGRAEESEFRERQLRERVEKLEGDLDFRLQQLEGQRQGSATPPARPAPQAAAPAATPARPAAAPAAARPPQRALAEGQAALGRRDYAAAETAAREVIASRDAARQVDAHLLLGDALMGRRNFAPAAIAYDDAVRRSPQGSRAPEGMLGIANALIGLNNNRDACAQLADLRSRYPNLSGALAERAADARRRAQCR
ncbi:tetratricopeptide repeat protein [Falsiroseomonas sp.]|uniref:tetratricopeptide repeat protein n=1 Tax=Falsiroseomonas sp. TaxID=2870721 RepID=UPI003567C7AE